ncbi:DUF465 domain-containing protein [Croceicoccus ponticola]|uniref:DUF465 domain-containing protein n=1 Tax=Croceicoccus ponticola TaxID=2217664 RepID=A0A437GY79_9SPHN|nr:DUF465 domain-containing protein [Croceicoccus ponticola]RVQ67618.1 DUF465 domain-containing protein [Croceicoccus ponticola]
MSERLFRLLERLQKLDDALRRAQSQDRRSNPLEMARLRLLRDALKRRLTGISPSRAPAPLRAIHA